MKRTPAELLAALGELVLELERQDNRITHLPVFMVQEKRRLCGIDPQWDPEICWIQSDYILTKESPGDDPSFGELETEYQEKGEEPEDWTRTGYIEEWHNVQPFLTEAGATAYLAVNGHNLHETRIYVESGWRNAEWELLREALGPLVELARSAVAS